MERFPDHVRAFIDRERWTFAKTMPEWPHEYLVRSREDETLFVATVVHIRTYGYEGHFYLRPITYFEEGDLVYWTMGAPIAEIRSSIDAVRKTPTKQERRPAHCQRDTRAIADSDDERLSNNRSGDF